VDKKPYWLAVLAYVVCTFLIAAPWHLVIFKPLYDELAIFSRREPIIPLGLLSMLIQALILSYVYPLFAKGNHSAGTGARFGLLVGILFASIAVIAEAAKHTVTSLPTWIALETAYYLLQFSFVGAVMGTIYAKGVPVHGL